MKKIKKHKYYAVNINYLGGDNADGKGEAQEARKSTSFNFCPVYYVGIYLIYSILGGQIFG